MLQVTDEDAADDGLTALQACATTAEGDSDGGWAIADGWVVIAETDEVAQGVADDAAEGTLADDATYQQWMDEVGDAGIMTAYVAPAAGEFMADGLDDLTGLFGGGEDFATSSGYVDPDDGRVGRGGGRRPTPCPRTTVPDEVDSALRDFEGMAMTMRFDDGAVELEMAGDPGVTEPSLYGSDQGADMVQTLPEDTAVAIGVGFADGWFGDALDRFASYAGDGTTADDLIAEAEEATGLDLPDDVETLFGDSFALALSSDFDPEAFFEAPDPAGFPVAAKVQGDPDGIAAVLDKLLAQLPPEEGAEPARHRHRG